MLRWGLCCAGLRSNGVGELMPSLTAVHLCRFALASFTDKFKQPSRVSPAIGAANAHLKGFAEAQDRVTYVDCSPVLLEKVLLHPSSTTGFGCGLLATVIMLNCALHLLYSIDVCAKGSASNLNSCPEWNPRVSKLQLCLAHSGCTVFA